MNIHEQHVSQAPVAAATPVPNPVISIDGQPVNLYLGSTNICGPDSDYLNVTYPEPGDAVQVSWDTYIIYGGSHPTPFSGFLTRQVKQQFSVTFTPGISSLVGRQLLSVGRKQRRQYSQAAYC